MKRNCWDLFIILASLGVTFVLGLGAFLAWGPFSK